MEYPKISLPIIIVGVIILFILTKKINDKRIEEERTVTEAKERFWEKYSAIRSKVTIPAETHIVCYKDGDANILNGNLHVWIKDGMLCFFPFIPSVDEGIDINERVNLLKIFIEDIDYYTAIDNRETILKYDFKEKNHSMIFTNKDYKIFRELLPEKDIKKINSI